MQGAVSLVARPTWRLHRELQRSPARPGSSTGRSSTLRRGRRLCSTSVIVGGSS